MGFIPMTLCSTFWSNRLPAHSCSQNEVNVFCPPTCVSGERGGEGEEWEWGGASAHHDPLQGGRGPGSEPAEGPQTGHHKVQVSPLPGEASRNHTMTNRQTDRRRVGGTEQGHLRSKTRSSTIKRGHHVDGWFLHARLYAWPQGFSRVKFSADSVKPFGWGI